MLHGSHRVSEQSSQAGAAILWSFSTLQQPVHLMGTFGYFREAVMQSLGGTLTKVMRPRDLLSSGKRELVFSPSGWGAGEQSWGTRGVAWVTPQTASLMLRQGCWPPGSTLDGLMEAVHQQPRPCSPQHPTPLQGDLPGSAIPGSHLSNAQGRPCSLPPLQVHALCAPVLCVQEAHDSKEGHREALHCKPSEWEGHSTVCSQPAPSPERQGAGKLDTPALEKGGGPWGTGTRQRCHLHMTSRNLGAALLPLFF